MVSACACEREGGRKREGTEARNRALVEIISANRSRARMTVLSLACEVAVSLTLTYTQIELVARHPRHRIVFQACTFKS